MRILKSSIILLVGEAVTMLCCVATLSLYARRFDKAHMSDYLLVLAGIAMTSPLLGMGAYPAVLFWVGKRAEQPKEAVKVLCAAIAIVAATGLTFLLLAGVLCGPLAELYFRRPGRWALLLSGCILLLARMSFSVTISYCWARGGGLVAGALQATVLGLIPLAVIAFGRSLHLAWLIAATGAVSLTVTSLYLAREVARPGLRARELFDGRVAKEVLTYGAPRVPAIVGYFVTFCIPTVLAKWLGCSDSEVVIVGASMTVLRMLAMSGRAVTYLGLPRISRISESNLPLLRKNLFRLGCLTVAAGLLGTGFFLALGDTLLKWWLHRPGLATGGITVFFWLAVAPFVIVVVAWPVIDGLSRRAHITRNVLIAIAMMIAVTLTIRRTAAPATALAAGTLSAITVLAALNAWTVRRLLYARN